jgi:hypothetical protein
MPNHDYPTMVACTMRRWGGHHRSDDPSSVQQTSLSHSLALLRASVLLSELYSQQKKTRETSAHHGKHTVQGFFSTKGTGQQQVFIPDYLPTSGIGDFSNWYGEKKFH